MKKREGGKKKIFLSGVIVILYVLFGLNQYGNVGLLLPTQTTVAAVPSAVGTQEMEATVTLTTRSELLGVGDIPELPEQTRPSKNRPPRYLFGIFTYDGGDEAARREAIRSSYLSYYATNPLPSANETRKSWKEEEGWNHTICSLNELLSNASRAENPMACRFVYTFVVGGGDRLTSPSLCYWPDCAKTYSEFVLPQGQTPFEMSDALRVERRKRDDFTFLSIRENHKEGKTESWFGFAAALATQRQELGIQFLGKTDSDTIVFVDMFLKMFDVNRRGAIIRNPYIYAGWLIPRSTCVKKHWGRACAAEGFNAPLFMLGGFVMVSQPLARHSFLDGLSLEEKRKAHHPPHEDMSLANILFQGAPTLSGNVTTLGVSDKVVAIHPYKIPSDFVSTYFRRCRCRTNEETKK
jgi:hypothetical protein